MTVTIDDGNVSFTPAEAADLRGAITAVPQALDNQWFDRELLAGVLQSGEVTKAIAEKRARRSRREYLRALLAAEKIVVNRAYLYNNPEVYRDYQREGPDREAFRHLLRDGVIMPWLLGEPSPVPAQAPEFETVDGFEAWREMAETTRMSCLRLSWDEAENAAMSRDLGREFGAFVNNLTQLEPDALQRDLALTDEEHARSVLARLREVGRWAHDELDADRTVTRQRLYERFVVADGTNVTDCRYDGAKPHAAEVKQLLDLKYATNLADAVDVFCITPGDSPRRTALQESLAARRGRGRAELPSTDADQLITLLRNLAFQDIQGLLEAVPTLDHLSLSDVHAVRLENEWADYRDIFAGLVQRRSVEAFADQDSGAQAVTGAYLSMLERAEEISTRRRGVERVERFAGLTEIGIDIGAITINAVFLRGHAPAFEVVGDTIGLAGARSARVAVRWGVGRILGRRSRRRLDTTAQILDLRLDDPKREARKLLDYLTDQTRLDTEPGNGPDMTDDSE
ncbi:hypothetical protein [Thermomonospora umbrina]|uniref:Uncharacterized protein n=1 Tax=Thermomonospora umbrina TaxID=111806 RepID=A0A3D9SSR8_9ACTN|nr:hypothetical protein [Thermomonospora umbrina]REE97033.1 hypothetical protein DFJ69_2488 [Thermomonospora umbrina]